MLYPCFVVRSILNHDVSLFKLSSMFWTNVAVPVLAVSYNVHPYLCVLVYPMLNVWNKVLFNALFYPLYPVQLNAK